MPVEVEEEATRLVIVLCSDLRIHLRIQIFLSSTCTYTKDMFKFDIILSLFAIFKSFT
jgi:hypothetical protein